MASRCASAEREKRAGNTTPAGITAAVVANVVLGAYVLAAMAEDASDAAETERRKRQ